MIHDRAEHRAALASSARRQVLVALRDSPVPLDAAGVADILGLHVTTARFHLDHLVDAGLAQRASAGEKRRGRPRILYSPVAESRTEDAREQLLNLLVTTLAGERDGRDEAVRAGHRWAAGFPAPTQSSSDPSRRLLAVLDRLGFDPQVDRNDIQLRACPFREAARNHPEVVCSIHRGLVEQLSETTVTLLPFVEPELCLVRLESEGDSGPVTRRSEPVPS